MFLYLFANVTKTLLHNYSALVKQKALDLGFVAIGISKAEFLEKEAPKLENWLTDNYHGKMAYMANHFDKRLDPRLLVDGAKSVISLIYNYYPSEVQPEDSEVKISKYAYGEDYHMVVKDKLFELLQWINTEIGEVGGRAFVDSAPVLERAWAAKSGLGWIGKNGNLITKQKGSFHFIAELIIDLELTYDTSLQTNHCGSCTACIDACPTQAIEAPALINGSKCISYFTIELKEAFDPHMPKWENWAFGCDICQDVCPWNRFSKPHQEPRFKPNEAITSFEKRHWTDITEDVFKKVFKNSPIKRTGYNGLKRNIDYLLKQS